MNTGNRIQCSLGEGLRRLRFCRYCRTKSLAQGMLDVALIFVNVAHLTSALRKGPNHQHLYYTTITIICLSLALEIFVAVMICVKEHFDLDNPNRHTMLNFLNNLLLWTVFASSVVHVFVAVFTDNHFHHHGLSTKSQLITDCNQTKNN